MARRRRVKVRITTSIDRDVLMWLKVRALETRMGYQTLMNRMLTEAIAREAAAAKTPPPVTRGEFETLSESVSGALKDIESSMALLKKAVQTAKRKPKRPTNRGKRRSARAFT